MQAYPFLKAAQFITVMTPIQTQFCFVTMLSDVSRGSGLDA